MFIRFILISTIFVASTGLPSWAQDRILNLEAGHSLLTNFLPANYDAEPQNWAFVEDDRGIIYVGNGSGVLEYDGNTWKQLSLPNRTLVRSLACDTLGRIWVGGKGELGYLTSDSLGSTIFVSLRNKIPEEHSNFLDVWNTYATGEGIYFNTTSAIFRWDGSTMKAWPPQTNFHMAFVVAGTFYVRQFGVGLMRMEQSADGEILRLIPGGERFANTRVYVMLPFDAEHILIGTREENLFLYDGAKVKAFSTEADHLLTDGGIYQPGVALPDGRFGLGTFSQGLVVIDRLGNLVEQVNNEAGLQDNTIFFAYADRRANVWLGMDKGIARVEVGSQFTRYDAKAGLPSSVTSMARYDGKLYVGEVNGLKRLHLPNRIFGSIESPLTQIFSLLPMEGELLATGANEGVYSITGDRVSPVRASLSSDYRAVSLHQWSKNPDIVVVGLTDGLALLRRSPEGWIDEGRVPDLGIDAWTIAEGSKGELWLGSESSYVARIRLPEIEEGKGINIKEIEVTIFGQEDGLDGGILRPYRIGDKVYITGLGETVFSFDEAEEHFSKNPIFQGASSGHPLGYFRLREDNEGRVWIATTYGAPVLAHPQIDGTYIFETLRQFYLKRIVDIYPEANGIVWLMGEDELIRYEVKNTLESETFPPPLIRQVLLGEKDILYGGSGEPMAAEITHKSGAIRFSYASPGESVQPRFRTQLEGFDEELSNWSTVSERSYTHLPHRDYRFRVEAEGSGEASYQFTVLPPMFQTWWARMGYGIAALLFIFVVVRWRTTNLKHRQKALEAEVTSATIEIRTQKEEVETQRDEIEAQRDELQIQRDLLVEQKQKITDSINYAKRIQTAVLPNQEYMDSVMPEYFVLFKPRDIVSGDFYWVKEVLDHLVIVGADCTGHGVPGAFMSMLGITLLNDLIGDRCFDAPSAILEKLRLKVKELLVQEGNSEEQKDGMDMVIAIFNRTTKELHFSGANNSLYIIRNKKLITGSQLEPYVSLDNENYQLFDLKGDKQPIGIHWEETKFTTHSISLQEHDAIYIFSDGVVDQKGGPNSKKFLSTNLKRSLLEIQTLSMEEQGKNLDETLEKWRKGFEQVDDILILGVRID